MKQDRKENYKRIREIYKETVGGESEQVDFLIEELLERQKKDGSFSVIDNYKADPDCIVEYVYMPTYYGAAVLMYGDRRFHYENDCAEYKALLKALEFSCGRRLKGAGYSEMRDMIKAFDIFADAGLFVWMQERKELKLPFQKMIGELLEFMEDSLKKGKTVFDWKEDFEGDFLRMLNRRQVML